MDHPAPRREIHRIIWLSHVLRDNYTSIIRRGGGTIEALFHDLGSRQTRG